MRFFLLPSVLRAPRDISFVKVKMANNEEAVIQAAGIAVMILEEEEEELQHALLVLAQIAVREIMELEEPWIDADDLTHPSPVEVK
ncbi:Cysteine--tRNA ligase [Frankliniella fusca]|uniref:Cysteine--tRNA ligase n=1 Tax=Frankliniella fusca TaxID=407009 RepID=A0AAE1HA19_9NEOP|nr:Cysteine--tRNA ligase [Frankliniella fusca]